VDARLKSLCDRCSDLNERVRSHFGTRQG
jgi:hypothetical protein